LPALNESDEFQGKWANWSEEVAAVVRGVEKKAFALSRMKELGTQDFATRDGVDTANFSGAMY